MPVYVEIAVCLPQVQGVYDYHVPDELDEQIQSGHLVLIPFGKQTIHGVVLREIDQPGVPETRAILEIVDPAVALTPHQLSLANYLAEHTLAPLSACINLMLPPGLAGQAEAIYRLHPQAAQAANSQERLSDLQSRVLNLLTKRGELRSGQIDRALAHINWRPAMRGLVRRGLVGTRAYLPVPKVRPKYVRTVQLACSAEQTEAAMPTLGRVGSAALNRRQAILAVLLRKSAPVEVGLVLAESGGKLDDLDALAKRGLVVVGQNQAWRDPLNQGVFIPDQALNLTSDQDLIWHKLLETLQAVPLKRTGGKALNPILLHGVTGSGKTEIYLQAVEETIKKDLQAIILVPEIALTPQTVQRFAARFPGKVGLIHSGLALGERYDTWRRARSGNLAVIIGARSALFAPLPRPGLIVVDECHDDSYYQSDSLPYYHAVTAAIAYARLSGAACVLGSATPNVTTTYQASQGRIQYLHLPARILAHRETIRAQLGQLSMDASQYHNLEGEAETIELPPVDVVDMRQELLAGNRSIFSRALEQALGHVLAQNQQAILFLNRRGTASYIFCRNCGHTLKCPRCDLPLTYHLDQQRDSLRCHYCGYERKLPSNCPACSSSQIRHYGSGTERVEAELLKKFPQARALRWDYETTRQKGAHEIILGHFAARHADILIGTQMIAKGLDLPLVTLVGVILADVGLSLPDYRAAERTFQVLTQVAGRAGRSPLGGRVILQTFQPEHEVIQAAAGHSYRDFYQSELEHRRRLGYPPFTRLVRLEYQQTDFHQAEQSALSLGAEIRKWLADPKNSVNEIIGPAPCFFQRIGGQYRWQIILRGPNPLLLFKDRQLPSGWKIEVNPPNLL